VNIEDFDYELPRELIAQEPLPSRPDSRMMILDRRSGIVEHGRFRDLPGYMSAGDALVVNDSRVIPARLLGRDPNGQDVEILLVTKMEEGVWTALVKPAKRVRAGLDIEIHAGDFHVHILENLKGSRRLVRLVSKRPISEILDRFGHVPLPPYIRRPDRPLDRERYQTVYAREPGSVAAPTAGLHFDDSIIGELRSKGVDFIPITLHVGPGTFRPIREVDRGDHQVDDEDFCVTAEAAEWINRVRESGHSITAVGTTTSRVLETVADKNGRVKSFVGWTNLFICPPYRFKCVDRLVTNFHLPKTTLLMLVAAFAGRDLIMEAYRKAIEERYRFYSYGDAMLII
jgi:S-adenosylmethionine:tRNA ribosyltransferase-isomerase